MKSKFFYLAMTAFLPAFSFQTNAKLIKIRIQRNSLRTETLQKPERSERNVMLNASDENKPRGI